MAGRPRRKRVFSALLVATVLLAGSATPLMRAIRVARADTLTVCPSGCTYTHIQDAINNASSGDTISIGAGTYAERLQVTYSITLTGAGADSTIIDGGQGGTVVTVNAGLTVNISGVTIQNGKVAGAAGAGGSAGGAGTGGGVYNSGTLTISNSAISGNEAVGGDGAVVSSGTTAPSGGDGDGGGIYNTGVLTVISTTISGNSSTGGGGGSDYVSCCNVTGGTGGAGNGSGIYNSGTLNLTGSTLNGNSASGGPGGTGENSACCGYAAGGGSGGAGAGAGVYNSGALTLSNSSVTANTATGGLGGYGDSYPSAENVGTAGAGQGAGLFNSNLANMSGSTIGNNVATGGPGSTSPPGASGAGSGGGIYNGGTLTLANSTISTNGAIGGTGGAGGTGPKGGDGTGGGILVAGPVTSANVTLGDNSASGGTGSSSGNGYGGGIDVASSSVTVQNTIIGRNSATSQGPDCLGSLSSDGYNLLASNTNCSGLTNIGDQTNVNPRLGGLQDNGGPTWTMALLASSPAINAGNPSGCVDTSGQPLTTDQRGLPRPDLVSGRCDIGAYEYQPVIPTPTNTPTPSSTSTPTPTFTSYPTYTPYPTNTPLPPTATNTPIPPTATNTPVATLAISPSSGVYGQSIRLTGANFGPREQVNIVAGRSSTAIYTATTTLSGSFSISNTVRQGVYGPLVLTAIGQSSHRQASAPFAIKAETLPRTVTVAPGGRVVLDGYGFGAHETVKATWAPGNLPLGHATTNSLGTFAGGTALTVTVPLSPTGTYHIYAVGQSSKAVAGSVVHLSGRGVPEADKRAAAP